MGIQIEKKGVYVVLYKLFENKINFLILKRSEDWVGWELLKGGVDEGENFIDTAKREALEEVGLDVDVVKSNQTNIFFSEKDGVKRRHTMNVFFAKVNDGNIVLSQEHSEFKFVSLDEALELLAFDDLKKIIQEVKTEIVNYENL
jgi:dihydroneopterin triphosphate diphosphatase